jgi:protein-L-isoaspartate(D-aspartate) O-methyltransferase
MKAMATLACSYTTLALVAGWWLLWLVACARSEAPSGEGPSAAERDVPPRPSDAAAQARSALVDHVARSSPGLDPRVLEVLRDVPRHLFMPHASLADAYLDHAFPIGHGQTISQPTVVAIMTDALRLTGSERVLEIGTGSGYQAAVLSRLAREVHTIEIVESLGNEARERLARLGYSNVQVRIGDGYRGWPELAPFDRIILTAAPPSLPPALIEQLVDGGVLVGPLGVGDDQSLVRWVKHGDRLEATTLGGVRFVPMVPATPPTP